MGRKIKIDFRNSSGKNITDISWEAKEFEDLSSPKNVVSGAIHSLFKSAPPLGMLVDMQCDHVVYNVEGDREIIFPMKEIPFKPEQG